MMTEAQNGFRVALIGSGAMANEHARAFADIPGVTLAGVFSRTREKAEQFARKFQIPEVCASASELYQRTAADLVVLAISPVHTKEIGLQCFQFPWCVLMEKPPGVNLHEAVSLQEAACRLQRKVLVALNRRFYFSTRTALHDLDQRSGDRHVHVLDQQSVDFAASLGHEQGILDNWHYCCSVHLVDYLRVFGRGQPSVTRTLRSNGRVRRVVVANLEFDSGDTAVYECIWSGPGPWAVMVTTPEKRWEMRPLESLSYQDAGQRVLVPVPINPRDTDFKAGFRLQAEHAMAAAQGKPSDSVTLDDALETVRLVNRIYDCE
jgi:predicted dehydrogenase